MATLSAFRCRLNGVSADYLLCRADREQGADQHATDGAAFER